MVTYEEARQFREAAGAPLTWEEDVPPPPLDRIEFTRLILEYAQEAGFGNIIYEGVVLGHPKEPFVSCLIRFQQNLHRHTFAQTHKGIPSTRRSGRTDGGTHVTLMVDLKWKEYIESLESDYFEPWKDAWIYGMAENSQVNVLNLIFEYLKNWYDIECADRSKMFPYDGLGLECSDYKIYDVISKKATENMVHHFRCKWWFVKYRVSVMKEIVFGKYDMIYFHGANLLIVCIVFITLFVFHIAVWFYPLVLVFLLIAMFMMYLFFWDNMTSVLKNSKMTFGDYASKIVKDRQALWLLLQKKYNVSVAQG